MSVISLAKPPKIAKVAHKHKVIQINATIEEVSLLFPENCLAKYYISRDIFALTVAAAREVVLKAFRQIVERTPYDEEVQIN